MELTRAQAGFLESSITDFRVGEWSVEAAGQAASTRRFFRISKNLESYILVEWDSKDEDWARFLEIESYMSSKTLLLPKIYANDPIQGFILEEDLGAVTLKDQIQSKNKNLLRGEVSPSLQSLRLFRYPLCGGDPRNAPHAVIRSGLNAKVKTHPSSIITQGGEGVDFNISTRPYAHVGALRGRSPRIGGSGKQFLGEAQKLVGARGTCPPLKDFDFNIYRLVIDTLFSWHYIDISNCKTITSRSMDIETFLWETGYFAKHCVTEYFGKGDLLTSDWENERGLMAARAAAIKPLVNMHRDFQSENVLICDGRIRFIDYQGARLGPAHYDAASLLFDPYITQLRDESRNRLIDYYLGESKLSDGGADPGVEKVNFYVCAAQRLMQALGAYANLSINKGKPHYSQYIPIAMERLSSILNEHLPDYTAMRRIVGCLS